MGSLGWPEIMLILVVALIIFGPRKLPELGKTLGESLAQFRRASEDFKRTWEAEVELEKTRIDAPKPAETTYSYGQDGSASAIETTPTTALETTLPAEPSAGPPEGTVPATTTVQTHDAAVPQP